MSSRNDMPLLATTRVAPRALLSLVGAGVADRISIALVSVAAFAVGLWVGLDLRSAPPLQAVDRLFLLSLALTVPLPIAALSALYHESLHRTLLPWPVRAQAHFDLGMRLLLRRHGAWGAVAVGAGLGAAWGRPPWAFFALAAFPTFVLASAFLLALGAAGAGAALADAEGGWISRTRAHLAGPFASPRHAPFFYLPALAFGLVAVLGMVALAGAATLAQGAGAGRGDFHALAWLALPLGVGIFGVLLGRLAYARHGLKTIARVHEEARTIYGGRPAPAEPPYGAAIGRVLSRRVAPYFDKELREQSRAHRALWAIVALSILVGVIYAVNVGARLAVAPFVAALVVIYVATLPLRRSPRLSGIDYLISLPLRRGAAWLGRWLALLWPLAHVFGAVALAIGLRHGREALLNIVVLGVATSMAATAATRARSGLRLRRRRDHWGIARNLVPAVAVAAALLGQRWLAIGWALEGVLVVYALIALFGGRR